VTAGGIGCVSTPPCDETYPGAKALSEPETMAIQGLLDKLFADAKGDIDDPAAASTTGVFLTLHSFGNDILAPWGYTNSDAPDKAALVALGKKMGALTGYPVSTGDGGVGYFAPGRRTTGCTAPAAYRRTRSRSDRTAGRAVGSCRRTRAWRRCSGRR